MIEGVIRRGRGRDGKPTQVERPDIKHEDKKKSFEHEPIGETAKNVMIALNIPEE